MNTPLAERLRPKVLADYIGQQQLLAEGQLLHGQLSTKVIPSIIFWGPPGVGKTTLAQMIAEQSGRQFFSLSAINAGVKDVREVLKRAEQARFFDAKNPILFIDEIHRFSKSQQDALLGAVEKGTVKLIGATTENPSFEVISALLSRCQVYVLIKLSKTELRDLLKRALTKDDYLKGLGVTVAEDDALLDYANGDGRKLLNSLELCVEQFKAETPIVLDNEKVLSALQYRTIRYDKQGEEHYDIISAFIKSIRGSDPNAAVYWLARMLEGGEDPKFIARRIVISAAEDIGLANPNALLMANTCFDAVHKIGMPEARIVLSQAVIYLATSAKSNASYMAINEALQAVRATGNLEVPLPLRNAPTKLMKDLGYGQAYKYSHDYPNNFVEQEFLPEQLVGKRFYTPQDNKTEQTILARIKQWWKNKY